MLTLDHHLVAGDQYLLSVAGLCVLQDGGSRLGSSCCSVGHGQSLEALDSICAVISQLNGPALCDRNCTIGETEKKRETLKHMKLMEVICTELKTKQ